MDLNIKTKNSFVQLFALTATGALMTAVAYALARNESLPHDDLGYGTPAFGDPLVGLGLLTGAALFTLLALPFSFWLLRRVDLRLGFFVVLAFALSGAAGVPLALHALGLHAPHLGLLCALPMTVGAMFHCRERFPLAATP